MAHFPNELPQEDELAKRFNLLCLKLQLSVLNGSSDFMGMRACVRDLLLRRSEKQTVPMVKQQLRIGNNLS